MLGPGSKREGVLFERSKGNTALGLAIGPETTEQEGLTQDEMTGQDAPGELAISQSLT